MFQVFHLSSDTCYKCFTCFKNRSGVAAGEPSAAAGAASGMMLLCVAGLTPSLQSSKHQVDVALKANVVSVCFECLRCFGGILQVFHMDVTKVDQDVSYVTMVVHVCCKCMFQMFHLFFKCMLQVYLYGCCLTHMLQIYYLNVAMFFNDFSSVFRCFC
jgi:hypothetical protein